MHSSVSGNMNGRCRRPGTDAYEACHLLQMPPQRSDTPPCDRVARALALASQFARVRSRFGGGGGLTRARAGGGVVGRITRVAAPGGWQRPPWGERTQGVNGSGPSHTRRSASHAGEAASSPCVQPERAACVALDAQRHAWHARDPAASPCCVALGGRLPSNGPPHVAGEHSSRPAPRSLRLRDALYG